MNWMGILKGAMWDEFTYKVKNDMFPTDLNEYVLYSKLMRDNKKTVDWYLEKGKSASSQEKKKLFRLILGEMLRGNNFNYWMTDQSNKAMLKSRQRWTIPNNAGDWYFIFNSDENVNRFIAEWGEKKDWMPDEGSLKRASDFVNKPKVYFYRDIAKVGNLDRSALMQKRQEWEPRYQKLKPIFDEIKAKHEKKTYGATENRAGMTDLFQLEVESILREDDLSLGDWTNLENRIDEFYQSAPEIKEGETEKRFKTRLRRWGYNRKKQLGVLADSIGDTLVTKHTLPEPTDEQPFTNVYLLLSTKDFREVTEDSTEFQESFQADYDVKTITLDLAKKYLDEYSTIRKVVTGNQKYSTDLLKLRLDGKPGGFLLLSKLQENAPKGMVNWTNKAFRKLLDTNQSLTEHEQWNQLKLEVETKFKFNEEALKQSWLEESWRMANSDEYSPTTASMGVRPKTRPKGAETSKEEYISGLTRALGEDEQYSQNLKDYVTAKKEGIQAFKDSIPKILVDFVAYVNKQLLGGKEEAVFKEALEDALGVERAEEYITLISGETASRTHGFRQQGSAGLGVKGEEVAVYSIPDRLKNAQTELITGLNDVLLNGEDIEGYEDFELEWSEFKGDAKTEDISTRLAQYGSTTSPFQSITELIKNETDRVLAEYIYTSYIEDSDILLYAKRGMKKKMGSGDYYIDEFIRMMFSAEESFAAVSNIYKALKELQEVINKAPKNDSEKMPYLNNSAKEGKAPFLQEIRKLREQMEKSIPAIKAGLQSQVQLNLQRIIKNKRRAKYEIPWLLRDLENDGFIEKKVKNDG